MVVNLPAAFAVAAVVEHIALVTQRGKTLGHFAPAVERAGVAVEKQQPAFGGRVGGKMQAVQNGAVGSRQADFFKRPRKAESVVLRQDCGAEQQPLLREIQRRQRQQDKHHGQRSQNGEQFFNADHLSGCFKQRFSGYPQRGRQPEKRGLLHAAHGGEILVGRT